MRERRYRNVARQGKAEVGRSDLGRWGHAREFCALIYTEGFLEQNLSDYFENLRFFLCQGWTLRSYIGRHLVRLGKFLFPARLASEAIHPRRLRLGYLHLTICNLYQARWNAGNEWRGRPEAAEN